MNALKEQGIITVGQVEHAPAHELIAIKGVGQTAANAIAERIAALHAFVREDGEFDWSGFWQKQGVRLLPEPPILVTTPLELAKALPLVTDGASFTG